MPLTHSQKKWQENHERLYQAALREIEKVGFNDVRIEKICEETKLSRPTFYAHFSNKDSIVSEMLSRFMDGISRELEARTKGALDLAQRRKIGPVADPRALARQITVVINGFFLAHPNAPDKAAREARAMLKLIVQGLRAG